MGRWKIDSIREFRNRISHNDGSDPLFTQKTVAIPYLQHIEALLSAVNSNSEECKAARRIIGDVHPGARQQFSRLVRGKSQWSIPLGGTLAATSLMIWLGIDHTFAPRISADTITVGTAEQDLDKYSGLKRELSSRLRVDNFWRHWLGHRIDVRLETTKSYPEAIARLRERKWDVAFGFSPVVSMYMLDRGYRTVGVMFPTEPVYSTIFFTTKKSTYTTLGSVKQSTRIALGDPFSASKYYMPLSMLWGLSATLLTDNTTPEIVSLVRNQKADIGVIAGQKSKFEANHLDLWVISTSQPLPQSMVGISPLMSNRDASVIKDLLLSMPPSVRRKDQANFGAGAPPDYREFRRTIEQARALSSCIRQSQGETQLSCGNGETRILEGWINDVSPSGNYILIEGITASKRTFTLDTNRDIVQRMLLGQTLASLKGRRIKALVLLESNSDRAQARIENPNQIELLD